MRSAQRTEHVTFSTLHSDELLSTKANISETKQKNLEKLAVQLLERHLPVIGNVFALKKNISEPREYNYLT